ncbi:MAG: hypothetical protein RIT45_2559 [Pseudomonadota bacterium]
MDQAEIANILSRALGAAADPPSFLPLVDGMRDAIRSAGVRVDRLQLPLSRLMGFRHPTLGLVLATWDDEQAHAATEVLTHAQLDSSASRGATGTPFEGLMARGEPYLLLPDLMQDDGGFAVLARLRDRGYRGYLALGLPSPQGHAQPLSICSREPYSADTAARLAPLAALMGIAVYAGYRTSQAVRLAQAYIGQESGTRVLAGEIQRGSTRRLEAGIVFCDIRGFTALSERLGAEGVVRVVNEVFAVIGEAAERRGGEILKFIGDAVLIVFPIATSRSAAAQAMVETAQQALAGVHALDAGVSVGFGGHIGEVVQGNIGTPSRLDFTVMGPAVNLASRLEGLCTPLRAEAVFSETVAEAVDGLRPAGSHTLKGVAEPVAVFVL